MLSMTGYGQTRREADGRIMTAEVRCVNHRFLDLGLRLPRTLTALENLTRQLAGEMLIRGHADITVTYQNTRDDAVTVQLDEGLAKAYQAAVGRLQDALALSGETPPVTYYAALPGVLKEQPADEDMEALAALLQETLTDAFGQVTAARAREGERLKADLAAHLGILSGLTAQLTTLAAGLPAEYQARLNERLSRLDVTADPQRVAQEVAIFADRCAIDEELSRLSAHIAEMERLLETPGPLGKQIDFLLQEMNREANTTASKSVSLEVTSLAVQCKNEIEKLREQAQNIL